MKTIKRGIENGAIRTMHDYEREIALMFMNAIVYNPTYHEVHDLTRDMARDAWKIIDVRT
jgi:bromodomain-containing protein 8